MKSSLHMAVMEVRKKATRKIITRRIIERRPVSHETHKVKY